MATTLSNHSHASSANGPRDDKQIRLDRWTAAISIGVMLAIIALTIWLATVTGVQPDGIQNWPMMS